MDDRTWIREDTLTMQLAIPLDLCIYNRQIYNDEMVQSNWSNWMTKDDWTPARTAQHCLVVCWTYTIQQGTYKYDEQA